METGIRQAYSSATDACEAAEEFYESVAQTDMALVMFFCSSDYDLNILAAELSRLFAGIQVVGCTTAGEIGPGGYQERGLTGASFATEACTAVSGYINHLQRFDISEGHALGQRLLQELGSKRLRRTRRTPLRSC